MGRGGLKVEHLKLFVASIICATAIGLVCKAFVIVGNAHADGKIKDAVVEIGETIKYVYDHIEFNPPPIKEKHPQ